jgi:hypothetical protein
MGAIEYLPLGSVVVIRGSVRKTMVIARGLAAEFGSETSMFDYAGCLYPEGLMGDQLAYFNHADIGQVVFEGFSDDDDALMVKNIQAWAEGVPYRRADPEEINRRAGVVAAGGEARDG